MATPSSLVSKMQSVFGPCSGFITCFPFCYSDPTEEISLTGLNEEQTETPSSLISNNQSVLSSNNSVGPTELNDEPTATPSSLISNIQSVLNSNNSVGPTALKLKIGLRNIKVRLICVRNLGDADKHAQMQSLFSRTEEVIVRVSTATRSEPFDDLRAVNWVAKEVDEECAWCTDTNPNHLTLDDVVEVADSLLNNIADFWYVVEVHLDRAAMLKSLRDAMDEFEVQARFLRDFLLFTKRAGVEIKQIQDSLILIRPFLWGVASAFQTNLPCPEDDEDWVDDQDWVEEVQSRFPQDSLLVFQFCTQTLLSMSTLDQTDDSVLKDFLSSLISLLWHLLRYQRHHPHHSESLKALYECLRYSRSILKQQQQTNVADFEDQIGFLIRDAGILICTLYLTGVDPQTLSDLLHRFDVVKLQVPLESNSLEAYALDFGDSTSIEDIFNDNLQTEIALTSHDSNATPRDVGFQEDEVCSVLNRLVRGTKQLRLVPITGMAGLGKTTFALKIYNHPTVMYLFHARAWVTISQVFNKKKVLIQLLQQVQPGAYSNMAEEDLANKLRRSLKAKRYLILLDDVWTHQVLESLGPSLPDDATQSRIILTSRHRAIIPHARPDEQPHFLRLRSDNECLEIIEMKLSHSVTLWTKLVNFAKLCKGLPLTAVIVAGLLSTTVERGSDGILEHLSLGGISHKEQCKIALELSYEQLPDDLKLCFIYLGVFQEDEEICARALIRLWMAEGFITRRNDLLESRIEDVAREYLDNLVQRNLVMLAKARSTGGIKTFRVHDLLHDFCLIKGKQENIFHLLLERRDELSDFNEPCKESRLSIHSGALHFKDSNLFCPLAHSILLFTPTRGIEYIRLHDIMFIIQIYKHLRVLHADRIWCDTPIPSEIEVLTRLTYLSIRCCKPVIPPSIGNLSNLETLIIGLVETGAVSLPRTIWNLRKLKYLRIISERRRDMYCFGFRLPIEDLENCPNLLKLEAICGVEFYSDGSMEKQLSKIPNIRNLKCNILDGWKGMNMTVLSQLNFLTLCTKDELQYKFDFGFAENLIKLTLKGFVLSREEIAMIGKLPNLEVLKLLGIVFVEGTMEMGEWEFSKLRVLEFGKYSWRGNLKSWTASGDEPLPCLEKLAFHGCSKLKEIPCSCLESSSTLEEIEMSSCSSTLEGLVIDIQKVQEKDYGYSIKVQIQHGERRMG